MWNDTYRDIITERALLLARQLGWSLETRQDDDTKIQITLTLHHDRIPREFQKTLASRLEDVLDALDWQLTQQTFDDYKITQTFIYARDIDDDT